MINWSDVIRYANQGSPAPDKKVSHTDAEWRARLTEEQFEVTRKRGTERPFTGEFCSSHEPGLYGCVCCETMLFDSTEKFESGTGWPSFTQPVKDNVIGYIKDTAYGMVRVEVVCNVCEAHLGHVFPDGPTKTGQRYCVNSLSITFDEKSEENPVFYLQYAYARISSITQQDNSSLKAQKQEFIQKGVPEKNIRFEIGSAADKIQERPVFYHLIADELKENDLLLVTKIDRCSRNTLEFLKLQERLYKKGVRFISLYLPYSSDMAVNQLISTNLAAIATFENERRKERQRQGIQAAKKNGKYLGRRTVIDKKLISQVQDLKENKNLSITEISKITGRARNTIYKILKEELNYISYNRLVKNVNQEAVNEEIKLSSDSFYSSRNILEK